MKVIINSIQKSIETKKSILSDEALLSTIREAAMRMVEAYKEDKKILFCGNGGSAGDAQHIAAELSGRFYVDRPPLAAEALHVNSSYMTAVANDYSYDLVYARMTQALGRSGDILVGISTSGNSTNVVRALERAKIQGMTTIGLTGESGGQMKELCDFLINVPAHDTPRIQESHILIGHILCQIIEEELFPQEEAKS